MNVEQNTELLDSKMLLENEYYKIQVKELELDGRYLFVRGIIFDINKNEASEFEDSIDLSDFLSDTSWKDQETDNDEE